MAASFLTFSLVSLSGDPVMAWLMLTATIVIVFNLVADICYGVLDPRVRFN